jgi:hypothetical protein
MPRNMRHRSTGVREYRSPGEAPSEALARRWKEREYIKTGLVVSIQRPFRGWMSMTYVSGLILSV